MQGDLLDEARRQAQICNACRYCEGYCDVFPQMHRLESLGDREISRLANICHNCRGCYYACQYTAPHEFDLNVPQIFAKIRSETWKDFVYPSSLARCFFELGVGRILGLVLILAFVIYGGLDRSNPGEGFYGLMSHRLMLIVFMPAFLLPWLMLGIGLWRYWRFLGGGWMGRANMARALHKVATLKNLSGGQGQGCNFEDEDAYSNARRWAHHLLFYGFLLCFLATAAATILHYVFAHPAPYGLLSLPKLLGISGGVMMVIGGIWMLMLKRDADPDLSDQNAQNAEYGFIVLLILVAASGLGLYVLGQSHALPMILSLHLASVLVLFLLTPYSKMAHGFYRLLAMMR